jgi:adenylate kinase
MGRPRCAIRVVLLGPPGAGKGTQAARLAARWGVTHISTGAILREAVKSRSALGLRVGAFIERGDLVDDETMSAVVLARLVQPNISAGFILDGYPRTVPQAKALDEFLDGELPVVVELLLSERGVLSRLASRIVCRDCGLNALEERHHPRCYDCGGVLVARHDDQERVVRHRLAEYRRERAALAAYYGARPTLREVDGAQPVDQVTLQIVSSVAAVSNLDLRRW